MVKGREWVRAVGSFVQLLNELLECFELSPRQLEELIAQVSVKAFTVAPKRYLDKVVVFSQVIKLFQRRKGCVEFVKGDVGHEWV